MTRRRFATAELDDAGLQARGLATDTTIRAVTWPDKGDRDRAAGGQQDRDAIAGVTRDDVRAADATAGITADVLIVRGVAYELDDVRPWASRTGGVQFREFRGRVVELETDYPIAAAAAVALGATL